LIIDASAFAEATTDKQCSILDALCWMRDTSSENFLDGNHGFWGLNADFADFFRLYLEILLQ